MKYIQEIAGKSGIYIISNEIDERIYVGSAKSFRHRCAVHKRTLVEGKHGNPKLMAFANKYGLDKLIFKPVFACSPEELLKYEQEYLDRLQPFDDKGFNILRTAGSPIGYKHTDEAKDKMKGRPGPKLTEDSRRRISESKKGIPRSEETKRKLREIHDSKRKPVFCYSINGFVKEYGCVGDIVRELNLDTGHVKSCIAGRIKTTNGYTFIRKSDIDKYDIELEIKRRFIKDNHRKVLVKFLSSGEEKEYNSIADLCRDISSNPPSVCTAIKRNSVLYGKYIIKYK